MGFPEMAETILAKNKNYGYFCLKIQVDMLAFSEKVFFLQIIIFSAGKKVSKK